MAETEFVNRGFLKFVRLQTKFKSEMDQQIWEDMSNMMLNHKINIRTQNWANLQPWQVRQFQDERTALQDLLLIAMAKNLIWGYFRNKWSRKETTAEVEFIGSPEYHMMNLWGVDDDLFQLLWKDTYDTQEGIHDIRFARMRLAGVQ